MSVLLGLYGLFFLIQSLEEVYFQECIIFCYLIRLHMHIFYKFQKFLYSCSLAVTFLHLFALI